VYASRTDSGPYTRSSGGRRKDHPHRVRDHMKKKYSGFTRRRFIGSSVGVAAALQFPHALSAFGLTPNPPICKLVPEQEVGPYYLANEFLRSDITEGKPGVPLALRVVVMDSRSCKPLANAAIDIWHCDALGLYSGFTKQNPTGPGGPPPDFDPQHPRNRSGPPENMGPPPENHPTDKLTFLRGIQFTGADGSVNFQTVFPGFYMGRTNHIHFKVRVGGNTDGKSYEAGHTSHIGQIFFPEEIAAELMKHEPYSLHTIHRVTSSEDDIFNDQHGDLSVAQIPLVRTGDSGFHADLVAYVDPTATPAATGRMRGPGGPPSHDDQH
jgi:protocatechuate 3,4-dioxygenase beta subunit